MYSIVYINGLQAVTVFLFPALSSAKVGCGRFYLETTPGGNSSCSKKSKNCAWTFPLHIPVPPSDKVDAPVELE
jgi:hypothetical protein